MTKNDREPAQRQRIATWEDPLIGAKAAQTMSGLAYLRAIVQGEFPAPPIAQLLNFDLTKVEPGRVVFAIEPAEYHYNPLGTVHGGLAATLCDSAMGCAVYSTLPQGKSFTTIELHLNYVRPLTTDTGCLHCIGEVIHLGRRIATAEAKLVDDDDKLYSHATTTCLIFQLEAGA